MFSPCVFFVCDYVCHDVCPDDLTINDRCHTKQIAVHSWSSCASYVSRTHGVIYDVTSSQNRSDFEIDISVNI